jgi:hypothetical protein
MHYSLQLGGFTVTAYHVALFILATYVPGAPYMYSHMVTVSVVVYSVLYCNVNFVVNVTVLLAAVQCTA